ncbi:MAG: TIGR04063 family PEP-CTERM/XrtA system glycosyltransferase [Woeseia sp.]
MTRILHVLDHSLPEQSGYASRSHGILSALAAMGLKVEAITSPKYGGRATAFDDIDSIRYWRTSVNTGEVTGGVFSQIQAILGTHRGIRRYCRDNGADLIHAHSPCLNGLAAMVMRNCPLVYEMRSSWEDAAVSSGTTTEGSLRYKLSRALETWVVRRAQAVTVICDGLKRELISRGISEEKLSVVPNALPADMFSLSTHAQSTAVRQRFGLGDNRVIGFFGSFFEWEGVDSLVKAMPKITAAVPNARLLLAGGGRQESFLRELVGERSLNDCVIFAGRIGPEAIREFYGAADVMVYPRISDRLTEMVTPLKPLEAMAQNTPVIASDIGGHRELIENEKTGFLYHAGDNNALAAKVVEVLGGGSAIDDVIRAARQRVDRERRWSVVCQRYVPIYERLLGRSLAITSEAATR